MCWVKGVQQGGGGMRADRGRVLLDQVPLVREVGTGWKGARLQHELRQVDLSFGDDRVLRRVGASVSRQRQAQSNGIA